MIDALESRRLLSVSMDFFNGVLTVAGDADKAGNPIDDRIVVLEDFDKGVFVVQNGKKSGPFDTSFMLEIHVNGGGGNDKILSRNSNGSAPVEIPMVISGSAGNDSIEGGDNGDTITGGSGNDTLAGGLGGGEPEGGAGDGTPDGADLAPRTV